VSAVPPVPDPNDPSTWEAATEGVTPETALLRQWRDLKTQIKNLEERAEGIQKQEIEPAMESGEVFEDGEMMLVFEYTQTPKFDAARALSEGAITQQTLDLYTTIGVSRKTMYRKRGDDEGAMKRQMMAELKDVYDRYAPKGKKKTV